MSTDNNQTIQLYWTSEHDCSYIDNMQARNLVLDPELTKNPGIYQLMVELGFRRSGGMVYRPNCIDCSQCIPIKIPVEGFAPNRSQRRNWKQNQQIIRVEDRPAEFQQEHFELFSNYLKSRHADGEMTHMGPEEYMQFLNCEWLDTRFIQLYKDDQLVGIAISDQLPSGLSAVYSFFDPAESRLGLGVYSILWQIEYCRSKRKPWLYLGYWIQSCRKMSYKANYKPNQIFVDEQWVTRKD